MAGDAPVRFLGRLDRPELLRCYAEHDILAFPSQWDEPFGLVPLEALACGLPVVATPTGGTPEAIVHEVTGLVVPAGDAAALAAALVRLAEQPGLAAALAEEGRRHVREAHAFPAFVERLRRLYLGVAGQQERAA
jgi:glycosyltransferase involved in cell wall biosynthesis